MGGDAVHAVWTITNEGSIFLTCTLMTIILWNGNERFWQVLVCIKHCFTEWAFFTATSLYRAVRFAKFERILGFSVPSSKRTLRKHMGTCTSSKGPGLWFVIGEFRAVLFVSYLKFRCFVIVLYQAIITSFKSLLRRFFWSFLFLSLARIKQRLPPSFDKKCTHHRNLLHYSWAV